ncbi:hypothetical protein OUZ56_014162 [Daphnia magna]|uniref:Uncharacterized protein n=1 Tax=Daphnia magna TaxID=35525 RepID=A0ABQ9Z7Z9_9CRUS|nr:hypothetical protein OUZ56_014162 [Daphnia magna]
MASSKVARRRQGSLGLPKDSPPPPTVNGAASPSQSLDNLEMIKTIGRVKVVEIKRRSCSAHLHLLDYDNEEAPG